MKRWLTEMLLLSVIIIWSANYTIGKYGVEQLSSFQFNTLRFLIAAPILLLITFVLEHALTIKWTDIHRLIWVSLVGITFYQTLFMLALKYTSATNTSILIALSPIFTSIFAVCSGQERFSLRIQSGSLLAFSGATVVILFRSTVSTNSHNDLLGIMIGLLASFCWGLYPVLAKPLVAKYSALRVTAWSAVIGVFPLIAISGWSLGHLSGISVMSWISLLYSIVFVTIYGLVIWYAGIGRIGVTSSMVYMYLVPVIAMLIASVILKERISPEQVIGTLIIFVGLWLIKKS